MIPITKFQTQEQTDLMQKQSLLVLRSGCVSCVCRFVLRHVALIWIFKERDEDDPFSSKSQV
jgi:hypothetical protein